MCSTRLRLTGIWRLYTYEAATSAQTIKKAATAAESEERMLFELLERKDAIGRHAAIPSTEIVCALHLENTRELRKIAANERLLHHPVLAGNTGYFLPETETDITDYIKRLRGQAAAINAVADALDEVKPDAAKKTRN